jgi:hypothetical protein
VVSPVVPIETDIKEDLKVDTSVVIATNMVDKVVYPQHVSIALILVTSHDFGLRRMGYVYICIVMNMIHRTLPNC